MTVSPKAMCLFFILFRVKTYILIHTHTHTHIKIPETECRKFVATPLSDYGKPGVRS